MWGHAGTPVKNKKRKISLKNKYLHKCADGWI